MDHGHQQSWWWLHKSNGQLKEDMPIIFLGMISTISTISKVRMIENTNVFFMIPHNNSAHKGLTDAVGYIGCIDQLTNPTMHLSPIPQCTIQYRNMHISVMNAALWDMGQVNFWICEFGLLDLHMLNYFMVAECHICKKAMAPSESMNQMGQDKWSDQKPSKAMGLLPDT